MSTPTGIDPRGPRFGASITAVALLVGVWLTIGLASQPVNMEAPGYVLIVVISAMFLWGVLGGVSALLGHDKLAATAGIGDGQHGLAHGAVPVRGD